MGWRTVVISKPSKLDLRLGYMVVRDCENTVRVHISEISVLIVENTVSSVTTALLNELTKQKIKVIFCDEKPNLNNDNLLSRLLDYIIMMRRYSSITCFVILNLHTYFSLTELELFYKELAYQSIEILVIENKKVFNSLQNEITYIVDEDMCEIIEN